VTPRFYIISLPTGEVAATNQTATAYQFANEDDYLVIDNDITQVIGPDDAFQDIKELT